MLCVLCVCVCVLLYKNIAFTLIRNTRLYGLASEYAIMGVYACACVCVRACVCLVCACVHDDDEENSINNTIILLISCDFI